MRITITIPDEVITLAETRGLTPESYVEKLVADAGGAFPVQQKMAGQRRDMESFFRAMALNSDNIPQLPDEAFTRESFYQDHD